MQPDRGRGAFHRGWGRRVPPAHGLPRGSRWGLSFPIFYPVYGGYQTPWVIEVSSSRITESSASHVITVPSKRAPARPVRSKVYEVRPVEDGGQEGAVEMTPIEGAATVEDEEMLVLVALKDGTIYATSDRWIEGDDLRFVGPAGAERIVALIDVDMRLSAQLNRERGAAFVLEAR